MWNAIEAVRFSEPQLQSEASGNKARGSSALRAPRTNDVGANPFSVVVVMKVLEECLISLPISDKRKKVGDNRRNAFPVFVNVELTFQYILGYIFSTVQTVVYLVSQDR